MENDQGKEEREQNGPIYPIPLESTVKLSPKVSIHLGQVLFHQVTRDRLKLFASEITGFDLYVGAAALGVAVTGAAALSTAPAQLSARIALGWESTTISAAFLALYSFMKSWHTRRRLSELIADLGEPMDPGPSRNTRRGAA